MGRHGRFWFLLHTHTLSEGVWMHELLLLMLLLLR
jgi:hypothetical protein